ncbi:MAG TPA: hypothetical protein VE010_22305 [Thermoanaerobaculia bacterium]|nr:hypothetical protein [Thermoanaerobaculia bacterium]
MRALVASILFAAFAAAAEPERGRLIENVVTRADAQQSYTLYLPTSYDPAKQHPALLVFDPLGRGTPAAKHFRDAAEEYGWVMLSSNGTRSGDGDANTRALAAMIPELDRYPIDRKRIYGAGFSGTAMLAWAVGIRAKLFHGVIGVGGRLVDVARPEDFTFAQYGFAGDADYNNREMREVHAILDAKGKVHRLVHFKGIHQWMSPELARDAAGWMELVAMKDGRRAKDDALIAKLYARDVANAAALGASRQHLDALRRYRAIVRTFTGLHAVDDALAAAARLEQPAAAELKDEAEWDAFERRFHSDVIDRLGRTAARLREQGALTRARLDRELRVPELRRRAEKPGREGLAAQRLLGSINGLVRMLVPELK